MLIILVTNLESFKSDINIKDQPLYFQYTTNANSSASNPGPEQECMGLSALYGTPYCGNYKINNSFCTPDINDCFIDINNHFKCWCKIIK